MAIGAITGKHTRYSAVPYLQRSEMGKKKRLKLTYDKIRRLPTTTSPERKTKIITLIKRASKRETVSSE